MKLLKKYKFIRKPLFYILSLLFSSWLVMEIEKKYPEKSKGDLLFSNKNFTEQKDFLIKLFSGYQSGLIDSNVFNRKLNHFLQIHNKQ